MSDIYVESNKYFMNTNIGKLFINQLDVYSYILNFCLYTNFKQDVDKYEKEMFSTKDTHENSQQKLINKINEILKTDNFNIWNALIKLFNYIYDNIFSEEVKSNYINLLTNKINTYTAKYNGSSQEKIKQELENKMDDFYKALGWEKSSFSSKKLEEFFSF